MDSSPRLKNDGVQNDNDLSVFLQKDMSRRSCDSFYYLGEHLNGDAAILDCANESTTIQPHFADYSSVLTFAFNAEHCFTLKIGLVIISGALYPE